MKILPFLLPALLLACGPETSFADDTDDAPPNIIYILADDLGYGELGCYGQTKIATPNIDRLAAEGMRFTQHYSGSPVCAPSRCTLLTGLHTGHAFVRDNREVGGWGPDEPEGQLPLPAGTETVARALHRRGYMTGAIGKWGLGGPGSTGHPNRQGFDHWFGYLCQRVAHNYYPTHLWRNEEKVMLEGNEYFAAHQRLAEPPADSAGYKQYAAAQFAPDLMIDAALQFVETNRQRPFFLLFETPVPHVALQVPEDSVDAYRSLGWDTEPYLGQKGYLPHGAPRAAYAAMISRLDRDIGRLLEQLDRLGLSERTVVMFSSDNGPTYAGGADSTFFRSAGALRGLKGSLHEGGIRVPLIVRWPGRVAPGSVSNHASAFWDVFPTVCELTGAAAPPELDGISFAPTLVGEPQRRHEALYWEYKGTQALRKGDVKMMRRGDDVRVYDLAADPSEERDLAGTLDDIEERLSEAMDRARVESREFPLGD